jgi:hypothetical protein
MNKLVINEDDPVYVTRYKIEMMGLSIKRQKYDTVLKFMNDLFETEHKSLTSFKCINMEKFDIDDMKNVVKEHKKNLKNRCKIEMNEDDVNEKYIVSCLRKMLTSIDYSFCKKMDSGLYYVKN